MRCLTIWILAVSIAAAMGGCSRTEDTGSRTQEQAAPASGVGVGSGGAGANLNDDEFVKDIAAKNMAEIEIGRLAAGRTTNPDIRAFAQLMIEEHGEVETALKKALSAHVVEWPGQMDEKLRDVASDLSAKQGAEFDRDFVEAMIDGHQDLAAKLESRLDVQSLAEWKTAAAARAESTSGPELDTAMQGVEIRPNKSGNETTVEINQWAADTYPVVQKHLDMARKLESATK